MYVDIDSTGFAAAAAAAATATATTLVPDPASHVKLGLAGGWRSGEGWDSRESSRLPMQCCGGRVPM